MGMKMYDLYLILNVFHSKGVALWAGDVYDYAILLLFFFGVFYCGQNHVYEPAFLR